jgi:hypothetical protein
LSSGDFDTSFVDRLRINKHRPLPTTRKIGKMPRQA